MVELGAALPQQLGEAEGLWQMVFGDDARFQRRFYQLCGLEGPLVLCDQGRVMAMLALPPVSLVFPDGTRGAGGYVYALATHPEGRGRGYASALLEYAAQVLTQRGAACMLTVPAQPALFDFFARNGFCPAFYQRRVEAQPAPVCAHRLTPEAYTAQREQLLAGQTYVSQGAGQAEVQGSLFGRPGRSGLYQLQLAHGPACAAVEDWPEGAVVKELLCAPEDWAQGAAGAAHLAGGPAQVRLVSGPEGTPYGAVRWLGGQVPAQWQARPWGWMGLGLD